MRTVMALQWKISKKSKDNKDYDLYCYLLDDGSEVETLREYKQGQKVVVWYDDVWHKAKMKPKKLLDSKHTKA